MNDSAPYELRLSTQVPDAPWDSFVRAAPGGDYHQSSRWAQVKAVMGWKCIRLLMCRGGQLVAGCQLLLKHVPFAGTIAYAPRAPLLATRSDDVLDQLLLALEELLRRERIVYLKLQPAADDRDVSRHLEERGFVASSLDAGPRATLRVDLGREPDSLRGAMHHNVRRNLRKAQQVGVVIRTGSERDLSAFGHLLEATGRRKGFSPYPVGYYERMWRAFACDDHSTLLIAEHDGTVLASSLVIGFGDTATYKMGAWAGTKRNVRPNELLHWTGMLWGKERGYRYYDFDDIEPDVAQAILAGDPPPAEAGGGLTRFKLGFGGEVSVLARTYDHTPSPLLGHVLKRLAPRLGRLRPLAKHALGRHRTGASL